MQLCPAVKQLIFQSFVLGHQVFVGLGDCFIHICESIVFLLDDRDLDGLLIELLSQFLNLLILLLCNTCMFSPQLIQSCLETLKFLLNGSDEFILIAVILSEKIIILQLILKVSHIFKQLLILFLQKPAIILKQCYLLQDQLHLPSFIFPTKIILIILSLIGLFFILTRTLLLPVHVLPLLVLKLLLDALAIHLQHALSRIIINAFNFISVMTKRIESIKQIAAKYSTFFFDLDGVIWKGSQKVKGGVETLHFLRESKKRIFFITNSSLRNKQMLKDRFSAFGFEAELDEIYPSDFITRQYVNQKYPNLKKLLVIGAQSLNEEIKKSGKEVVHLSTLNLAECVSQEFKILIDPSIDGVIMGYDKNLSYKEIVLISAYVQSGAKFIGTNPDKYTIIGDFKIPGCGSMIKCIEAASSINAEYAGKPNPFIIDFLIQSLKLDKSECLMIGDNLQTDVTFGKNSGIDTLCVLTGVSTQIMVKESNISTYYAEYLL